MRVNNMPPLRGLGISLRLVFYKDAAPDGAVRTEPHHTTPHHIHDEPAPTPSGLLHPQEARGRFVCGGFEQAAVAEGEVIGGDGIFLHVRFQPQ